MSLFAAARTPVDVDYAVLERWIRPVIVLLAASLTACAGGPPQATAPPPAPAPPTTLQVGETTVLAVSPPTQPCCPKPTLLDFLGITQVCKAGTGCVQTIGSRIRSRLGMWFPGLEPKPPLLPITDPANMTETSPPAVKTAAEVKQEEDAAPQKVKALRYLATIGCGGCYPGIEEAFLAALDDCTEEVRYEAVLAIRGTASIPCQYCKTQACCSEKIRQKLDQLAYKTDNSGCYAEGSDRVRRMARLALAACGSPVSRPAELPTEGPAVEVPQGSDSTAGGTITPAAPTSPASVSAGATGGQGTAGMASAPLNDVVYVEPQLVHARVNGVPVLGGHLIERLKRTRGEAILVPSGDGPSGWPREAVEEALREAIDEELLKQRAAEAHKTVVQLLADAAGEVTHAEVAAYFQEHGQLSAPRTEVRWEVATIPRQSGTTRDAAYQHLDYVRARAMGEPAEPSRAPAAGVIRTRSFDWTVPSTVTPRIFGTALANLPVGRVSGVLEDEQGWHLLRVIERRSAAPADLQALYGEIRQRILDKRRTEQKKRMLDELHAESVIWSVCESHDVGQDDGQSLHTGREGHSGGARALNGPVETVGASLHFSRPCCN